MKYKFMGKEIKILLQHILESIEYIEQYTSKISLKEFKYSIQSQDSVIRRLEIIGEAVKNLPNDFKATTPYISWREMAGMRDVLIHEYFGVDIDLVWNTTKKDLPILKKEINELLN